MNRNETLAQKLRTRMHAKSRRKERERAEASVKREENRATQRRLLLMIIIIIILILSGFHSCILADKSNVAQLTKTNCRELNMNVVIHERVCVPVRAVCVCMYACKCEGRWKGRRR